MVVVWSLYGCCMAVVWLLYGVMYEFCMVFNWTIVGFDVGFVRFITGFVWYVMNFI